MFQSVPRSEIRFTVLLLAIFIVLFQLWRLKTLFDSSRQSTRHISVNIGDKYGATRLSGGRTYKWNSATDSIVYKLDSSAVLASLESENVKSDGLPLKFGHGYAVKPYKVIMEAPWVAVLQDLLKKAQPPTVSTNRTTQHLLTHNQVTVVVSNSNYTLSLLNWLVSAFIKTSPPLDNVIVVSLDKTLQALLDRKEISSVYVDPGTVISGQMHTRSSHIWITRGALYRLLNHLGYDVITYDTDAIALKNLQPILDAHPASDIVASSGIYPFQLGMKWGLTLCMGVILIRSTARTELLWNTLSQTRNDTHDDQVKLNYALENCKIKWFNDGRNINNQAITGECARGKLAGLKVTVLPRTIICRRCKKQTKSYYVWHNRAKRRGDVKVKTAVSGNTWFLKDSVAVEDGIFKESEETEKLKGHMWLSAISSHHHGHDKI